MWHDETKSTAHELYNCTRWNVMTRKEITYRITYGLLWITMILVTSDWFANNFHEWLSHEWKSFANHPISDQKPISHGNPCVNLSLTCFSGAKPQRNWREFPLIDQRTLIVYSGSVKCVIVTSCKHLLWRHLDGLSSAGFQVGQFPS